jgi:hypothetical protein
MKRLIILCAFLLISINSYAAVPLLHVSSDNPTYLANPSGNIVILGGMYDGLSIQENMIFCTPSVNCSPTSITTQAAFNSTHGNNFIRLFVTENSKDDKGLITPTIFSRSTTPGAVDGGNKFDLTQFNIGNLVTPDVNSNAYFERLRARVIAAGNSNQYVSVMLFNAFNWENGGRYAANTAWLYNPYRSINNVNSINGDANNDGTGTEMQTPVTVINNIQKAYVAQVIDSLNDLDNVLWEICNECLPTSVAWQNDLITFIRNYETGKPKKHPIILSVNSDYNQTVLTNSTADVLVIGGPTIDSNPSIIPNRVIVHDTDHSRPCELFPDGIAWKLLSRGQSLSYFDCPWAGQSNDTIISDRIGQAVSYVNKVNFKTLLPNQNCSTTYCLSSNTEHLLYLPTGGNVSVTLSGLNYYNAEWLNVVSGVTQNVTNINPGLQTLSSPFGSTESVVWVKDSGVAAPNSVTYNFTSKFFRNLKPGMLIVPI